VKGEDAYLYSGCCCMVVPNEMKRGANDTADEERWESNSNAKQSRRDHNDSCALESSGSSLVLARNSSQTKDGIIEEVRVTNFMSFNSHKFRLVLLFSDFNLVLHLMCKQLQFPVVLCTCTTCTYNVFYEFVLVLLRFHAGRGQLVSVQFWGKNRGFGSVQFGFLTSTKTSTEVQ